MELASIRVIMEWAAKEAYHTGEANKASAKWQKRKEYLQAYMAKNAHNYTTEKQRRDKVANDWDLTDAMDAWNWHRREANRLGSLIRTQEALRSIQNMEASRAKEGYGAF